MGMMKIERFVDAPKEVVWTVISDLEGYADAAPNLTRAVIESGQGEGMKRRCWDTRGGTWQEECVLWEEGVSYAMQVDTSDYPYPFAEMRGEWSLAADGKGTRITMRFDFRPKYGIVGDMMVAVAMRRSFQRIGEQLMDNWQTQIADRQRTALLAAT